MIKHIKGDLIALAKVGLFDYIIHGCNCFHTMGAGVAKGIKDNFPEAYAADKRTQYGDKDKLGIYSVAYILNFDSPFAVINAYTQFKPGANFSLEAYSNVMRLISNDIGSGAIIGMPMIGSGIGGGNWKDIYRITFDIFSESSSVLYIVEYAK